MSQVVNPDPDLMRIFDFTPADLEANRAGRMSERQAKYLKGESDADRYAVNCALMVALLVAGCLVLAYMLHQLDLKSMSFNALSQTAVIMGVLILLYLRYRSNQNSIQTDLKARYVGKIEGALTWQVVEGYKEYIYQITIDGKTFRVEKRIYQAFDSFMKLRSKYSIFRVYFTPETSCILSVEIIPQ